MKNLKFRIWDKQIKIFLFQLPQQHHLDWERFDVQQFTGLLDKQSKEIYEGDILQLHCGCEDGATERHKIRAEVLWCEDRFVARIPDKIVKVKGGSMDGKMCSWREIHSWNGEHNCLLVWQEKLEVIGNIYENPNLLK
jgi:uncharacterized phage protein (TIGR01671 family)